MGARIDDAKRAQYALYRYQMAMPRLRAAKMAGVSNATIAYNHGQYDMAATFQTEAIKAAESGDFQYFVDHGYQG